MQAIEIEATGFVVTGEVDVFPHPVDIDGRVDAVILQKRHRDTRDRRRFNIGKGSFQNRKAGNAHNRFNLSGLDQRHDDCGSFRNQHRVSEPLGLILKILNRAKPALFAEQAKLIERSGTFVLDAEAFRHQKKASLVGNLGERLAPHLIVQTNGSIVKVGIIPFVIELRENLFGVLIQFLDRHGRDRGLCLNVVTNGLEKLIPFCLGLRNVFLGRTKACGRYWNRLGHLDGLDAIDRSRHENIGFPLRDAGNRRPNRVRSTTQQG